MAKSKTKLPIKRYLIYILIAVVLISNTTFSRYVSTSSGGSSVSVALFASDVSYVEDVQIPISIHPGETVEFHIILTNFELDGDNRVSQVSQRYKLSHELMANRLPLTVTYDKQWNDMQLTNSNNGKITHTQTITVTWDNSQPGNNDYTLADEIEVIRILVNVEQID